MAVLGVMQAAMEQAVALLNDIGTDCTYTPKSTGVGIPVKAVVRELGTLELVGDYRQGDLRVELDASLLPDSPKRYDTLTIGTRTYAIRDYAGAERRAGNIVYTYKFIVRGE